MGRRRTPTTFNGRINMQVRRLVIQIIGEVNGPSIRVTDDCRRWRLLLLLLNVRRVVHTFVDNMLLVRLDYLGLLGWRL